MKCCMEKFSSWLFNSINFHCEHSCLWNYCFIPISSTRTISFYVRVFICNSFTCNENDLQLFFYWEREKGGGRSRGGAGWYWTVQRRKSESQLKWKNRRADGLFLILSKFIGLCDSHKSIWYYKTAKMELNTTKIWVVRAGFAKQILPIEIENEHSRSEIGFTSLSILP